MCEAHAHHSVKNRGAEDQGPYEGPAPEPSAADIGHNSGETQLTDDDLNAYAEDAQLSSEQKGNILSQITNTVHELRDAEEDIKAAEAMLKAAQERRRNIAETILPALMDEAQQKRLTTLDGWEVSRSEVVRASIPPHYLADAIQWLTENGQGAIVKRDISLKYGKGEEKQADDAVRLLTQNKHFPTDKMSVHPQTLGAVVREMMAEGKELPMELLGIYVQPVVKITEPS